NTCRILYDIPCKVCQDHSSGKHYGIFACDGCAGFFKRSIRRQRQYVCKAKAEGNCVVDKTHRNQCRACRLRKCVKVGMNKDAVQHERGPRNATIRRQLGLLYNDPNSPPPRDIAGTLSIGTMSSMLQAQTAQSPVLNLALPKVARPAVTSTSTVAAAAAAATIPNSDTTHSYCPVCWKLSKNLCMTFLYNAYATSCVLFIESKPRPHELFPKIPMELSVPMPFPSHTADTLCECAARILFMNINWVTSLPMFLTLNYHNQLLLLEQSWRELFVLGAAQYLAHLDVCHLVNSCGALKRRELQTDPTFMNETRKFHDTLTKFKHLSVDPQEYGFLRAIVLFKTSGPVFILTAFLATLPSLTMNNSSY
ncbi:hypothetical protein L9F63_021583, partial [Diploptera punctata]